MLSGTRVVELGTAVTAPVAAMLLADMGASVIKVERPGGDPYRHYPGMTPQFAAANRNKESIVCDLGGEDGRRQLLELLADADVFIENMRPGVMERLGFGAAFLAERFPKLIYCSVTGFGATGPYRDRPAFDGVAAAITGLTSRLIDPNAQELCGVPIVFGDVSTAMYAAIAILGALIERGRTGVGTRLELNMLEATMAYIGYLFTGMKPGVDPPQSHGPAASQSYIVRCKDGLMLAIHMSSPEKFWRNLVDVAEAHDLTEDPRFVTRPKRVEHYHDLARELNARFGKRTRAEWMERLGRSDVPFAPVQSLVDVVNDPQVAALGTLYEVENDVGPGKRVGIQAPILVNGQRPGPIRPAPELDSYRPQPSSGARVG
jgi:formyl-CoA transferase